MSYSIRHDWFKFCDQLDTCVKSLKKACSLEDYIDLQVGLNYLGNLCKKQSLHQIFSINTKNCFSSALNNIINIKTLILEKHSIDKIEVFREAAIKNLENLLLVSKEKRNAVVSELGSSSVQETIDKLQDYNAPKELIDSYLKHKISLNKETEIFNNINDMIHNEVKTIKKALEEDKSYVRGSVTIKSFIREIDLADHEHIMLKSPNIAYNSAHEKILPIYIFSNQILYIAKTKQIRLSFKKRAFESESSLLNKANQKASARFPDLLNQSKNLNIEFISKHFKNVRFIWMAKNVPIFRRIQSDSVNLLW